MPTPSGSCATDGGSVNAATWHDAASALDGAVRPDGAGLADALAPIDSSVLDDAGTDGPADDGGMVAIYGAPEIPDADLTAVPDAGS